MNAECPRCAESDQTVSMPHALTDTDHTLGAPEYGLLLPPPPPAPAAVERSTPAIVLYAVAGAITVLWLINVAKGLPDPEVADASYRVGYAIGPLVFSVPLAAAGLIVQLATQQRRARVAEEGARARYTIWERYHRIWQAAWLCRRCRVAFFPKGSVSPNYPASPALEVVHFPVWVTRTAEHPFDVPVRADPR